MVEFLKCRQNMLCVDVAIFGLKDLLAVHQTIAHLDGFGNVLPFVVADHQLQCPMLPVEYVPHFLNLVEALSADQSFRLVRCEAARQDGEPEASSHQFFQSENRGYKRFGIVSIPLQ